MLPHDVSVTRIPLPSGDRHSFMLISGSAPRHHRLGYLIQRRYPGALKVWMASEAHPQPTDQSSTGESVSVSRVKHLLQADGLRELTSRGRRWIRRGGLRRHMAGIRTRRLAALHEKQADEIEGLMFARALSVSGSATLRPTSMRFDATALEEFVRNSGAYFVVVYDAALPDGLVAPARGVMLRQHDGWRPLFSGPTAVDAALYGRQPHMVGSTVALSLATHAAPMIVRRSSATLHPDDSVAHCRGAAAALGHALLLDTIDEALRDGELRADATPSNHSLRPPFRPSTLTYEAVRRDFAAGWLDAALADERDF